MNKRTLIIVIGLVLIIVGSIVYATTNNRQEKIMATVYKSPTCGCCGNYIPYLRGEGFKVNVVNVEDISKIKSERGIPEGMESCHTIIIGNYFVEGHVPMKAIKKLLKENPDIDGIALPNMPSGSPGMPGQKRGDFIVYSIKDGQTSEFMTI